MQLRHIRPRSLEWYDALMEEVERGLEALGPEEKMKLRKLAATAEVPLAHLRPEGTRGLDLRAR